MTSRTGSSAGSRPDPRPRDAASRPRDPALGVFTAMTAVGLLHAVDDALLNRQPGVPVDQHLPALLAVGIGASLSWIAFRRYGTGVRAAAALVVGALTTVNGALHVAHVLSAEASGSDVTGVLAAVAGVVLLVLSGTLPLLHRGERRLDPRRRWGVRVAVTAATVGVVQLLVIPIGVGIGQTHLHRQEIGGPPPGFGAVSFESTDGLDLSGWYARSHNRGAVVVVNSARGDRLGSVRHARLLAGHGYGVLLYDARGSGDSEGTPNGYGWGWEGDVLGALEFLGSRSDVDAQRIGALGLSTGADVLLQVAGQDRRLAAVVADGSTGSSLADLREGDVMGAVTMAPVLSAVRLFSGTGPGEPLREAAARSSTRLLFVATGGMPGEIAMTRTYAEAAGGPVELWELPEAGHTTAIRDDADAYARRIVGHFDTALLGDEATRGDTTPWRDPTWH